jgi:hypothetical protein
MNAPKQPNTFCYDDSAKKAQSRAMEANYMEHPSVMIFRNEEPLAIVGLTESEWRRIHRVNYIAIDNNNALVAEFNVHGSQACAEMLTIVKRVLGRIQSSVRF